MEVRIRAPSSANPDILYQQNHCGVYRTENAGDDWIDISDGLPSRFGFPFAILPNDGDTVFVCPRRWELTGPIFKGVQVDHVAYAPDAGGAIVVTGTSACRRSSSTRSGDRPPKTQSLN